MGLLKFGRIIKVVTGTSTLPLVDDNLDGLLSSGEVRDDDGSSGIGNTGLITHPRRELIRCAVWSPEVVGVCLVQVGQT